MPNLGLSCLICSNRAPDTLSLLFETLRQQAWEPGDEVVFVDNGIPEEKLPALQVELASLKKKNLQVTYVKEPLPGLTNARLRSFEVSKNPWLVLLDDDNSLGPYALHHLRNTLREDNDLGGVCPQIRPIWAKVPDNWIIILGHHVLSYNNSALVHEPLIFGLWRGGALGARPPGGGMIIHRSAAENFTELCRTVPLVRSFGRSGRSLLACEDFILYNQIYMLRKPTAYAHDVLINHHIPEHRMRLGYIVKLAFWTHYSFGFLAIMRRGKSLVLYSLYRHWGMLILSMIYHGRYILLWPVLTGYAAMFLGAFLGAVSGLMNKKAARIYIDPVEVDPAGGK